MSFGTYKKGSRAELELVKKLIEKGFSVIRAAGSGSGTPCPDVLAFKRTEQFGFECKAINKASLQLRIEQIDDLRRWQENTNITSYVAWRIQRGEWIFIRLEYLKKNPKSYSITYTNAKKMGINFEQLIRYINTN